MFQCNGAGPSFLAFAACCIFPSLLDGPDGLNRRLKRIFDSDAFAGKRCGPARWIRGGAAYTTLEATGKRAIRFACATDAAESQKAARQ